MNIEEEAIIRLFHILLQGLLLLGQKLGHLAYQEVLVGQQFGG
jgi:hypothetical protein